MEASLRCLLFGHQTKQTEAVTYVRRDLVEDAADLLRDDRMYTKGIVTTETCTRIGCTHRTDEHEKVTVDE